MTYPDAQGVLMDFVRVAGPRCAPSLPALTSAPLLARVPSFQLRPAGNVPGRAHQRMSSSGSLEIR